MKYEIAEQKNNRKQNKVQISCHDLATIYRL